ncbi:MAG: pyridoxal-phosphate dependent enzyme [Croceitalea sp.]|nr:pyridoxal-phosphate dependent enzyme [Croceitalea sp.]
MPSPNQSIDLPLLKEKGIVLYIKREDTLHPFISGNKYRKLKYNILEALKLGHHTMLTFGGAYSNHIAATAYACKEAGLKSIGIIRGEELLDKWQENPTLDKAKENGMQFLFINREQYRLRNTAPFLKQLEKQFGKTFVLPEGGTNELAIKGCEEILNSDDEKFDLIATCVGTGGTIAGLINSSKAHQKVLGFQSVGGDFLFNDIRKFVKKENWSLIAKYDFGGYARVTPELIEFINTFRANTNVPLDPIYTGKLFYGILDMIAKDAFKPETKILAIHTGGLQGIQGMNIVLKKKNLPLIDLMIQKYIQILIACLLLIGCGARKRNSTTVSTETEQKGVYQPNVGIEGTKFDKSELYPLPVDPGKFVTFPINSTAEYIAEFSKIAQYEMRAFGIPASITLAQGILESGSGKGALTQKTNNHFGIKCHKGWQGDYDFHDDDAKGECFRKYNHPMYSFRDHSIFLASRSRYRFLFNYRRDNYKKWAHGLRQAGYATDKKYPEKLISLIERYNLDEYDDEVVDAGLEPVRQPKKYDVFTHIVDAGDTLYGISKKYAISVEEIMQLNSLDSTRLTIGQIINIRKERSK